MVLLVVRVFPRRVHRICNRTAARPPQVISQAFYLPFAVKRQVVIVNIDLEFFSNQIGEGFIGELRAKPPHT